MFPALIGGLRSNGSSGIKEIFINSTNQLMQNVLSTQEICSSDPVDGCTPLNNDLAGGGVKMVHQKMVGLKEVGSEFF